MSISAAPKKRHRVSFVPFSLLCEGALGSCRICCDIPASMRLISIGTRNSGLTWTRFRRQRTRFMPFPRQDRFDRLSRSVIAVAALFCSLHPAFKETYLSRCRCIISLIVLFTTVMYILIGMASRSSHSVPFRATSAGKHQNLDAYCPSGHFPRFLCE